MRLSAIFDATLVAIVMANGSAMQLMLADRPLADPALGFGRTEFHVARSKKFVT